MQTTLSKLVNSTKNFEIVFHLVSGKSQTYSSSEGKIDLINPSDVIIFTDGADTIILNIKNIEYVDFRPII